MLSQKEYWKTERYLDSFINYEEKVNFAYKKSLKLERVKYLLNALNIPYGNLGIIHIAGTKGKGSAAHLCANLLAALGFKTGLYTSPHFFSFRERIAIVSQAQGYKPQDKKIITRMISKSDLARIVKEMRPKLEEIRFTKKLGHLTFFEVYTAVAFKYFLEKDVDFAVLETGLGGRLDATNVATPLVGMITHIGYDHTDKLGNRLEEIAYEKAGIIKRGLKVVSSPQRGGVSKVIRKRCRQMQAELYLLGKDFFVKNIRLRRNYTLFDFNLNSFKLKNLKIFLKGYAQVENAACALAAVSLLNKKRILQKEIRRGFAETSIEGRFEIVKNNPLMIIDVAHNPSSFSVLRENLKLYFPNKKIILIFAVSQDKNVKTMLSEIPVEHLILTTFSNPRCLNPGGIKAKCKLRNVSITKDIKEAVSLAKKFYKNNHLILISGSLFLASEAKQLLGEISWESLG